MPEAWRRCTQAKGHGPLSPSAQESFRGHAASLLEEDDWLAQVLLLASRRTPTHTDTPLALHALPVDNKTTLRRTCSNATPSSKASGLEEAVDALHTSMEGRRMPSRGVQDDILQLTALVQWLRLSHTGNNAHKVLLRNCDLRCVPGNMRRMYMQLQLAGREAAQSVATRLCGRHPGGLGGAWCPCSRYNGRNTAKQQ